jgi:hypothetical protein
MAAAGAKGKWLADPGDARRHLSQGVRGDMKDLEFQMVFTKTESADYKAMSVKDI